MCLASVFLPFYPLFSPFVFLMRLGLAPGHTARSPWTSSLYFRGPMRPCGRKTKELCFGEKAEELESSDTIKEPALWLLAPVGRTWVKSRDFPQARALSGEKPWSKNNGNVSQIYSPSPQKQGKLWHWKEVTINQVFPALMEIRAQDGNTISQRPLLEEIKESSQNSKGSLPTRLKLPQSKRMPPCPCLAPATRLWDSESPQSG